MQTTGDLQIVTSNDLRAQGKNSHIVESMLTIKMTEQKGA